MPILTKKSRCNFWIIILTFFGLLPFYANAVIWQSLETTESTAVMSRHETGAVVVDGTIYIFGGRNERPVQKYDSVSKSWITVADMPLEMHHFQPVAIGDMVYVVGALTCCYPQEPTVEEIYRFDTTTNVWSVVGTIPTDRLRGAGGTVVRAGKIYQLGGNTLGHNGGAVAWLDEFDPETGEWSILPDAPNARDHFDAVLVNDRIIAVSGRQSAGNPGNLVKETDIYDFATGKWTSGASIPVKRGGAMAVSSDNSVYIIGGEVKHHTDAYNFVEVYDLESNIWHDQPPLSVGRHAGAAVVLNDTIHVIAGNTLRGGGAETNSHETLSLADSDGDGLRDIDEVYIHNTVVDRSDSDGDDLDDGFEINISKTDPLLEDTDEDGLNDGEEYHTYNSDPLKEDTDEDGLTDGDEVGLHNTDPVLKDTDSDGVEDADEISAGTSPVLSDTDGDGLSDSEEISAQTNPLKADTDGDGLSDGDEVKVYDIDPLNTDTDSDGYTDGDEVQIYDTDPSTAEPETEDASNVDDTPDTTDTSETEDAHDTEDSHDADNNEHTPQDEGSGDGDGDGDNTDNEVIAENNGEEGSASQEASEDTADLTEHSGGGGLLNTLFILILLITPITTRRFTNSTNQSHQLA